MQIIKADRELGPFYKSMKRKYAEQFFATGKLRVGSLYDFRKVEDYDEDIGDEGEGTKALWTNQRHITERSIPPFLQGHIRAGGGNRLDIIIDNPNTQVTAQFQDPNYYIFCLSFDFSEARMRKLKHDACIVIEHLSFFTFLHVAMDPYILQDSKGVFSDVLYGPRRHFHSLDPRLPMYRVKPERYGYQNEARVAWIPRPDQPVQPHLYLNVPSARRSCRQEPVLIDL
jgi:hypothetical protein